MQRRNEPVVVLGDAIAIPVVNGIFASVSVEIPEGCQLVASLFGELKVNPTTTILDRVVTGLDWIAQFKPIAQSNNSQDSQAVKPFPLTPENGGKLRWTRNDGWPLSRVLVPTSGVFIFGCNRTAAPPGTVVAAMSGIRGMLIAKDVPERELRDLVAQGMGW